MQMIDAAGVHRLLNYTALIEGLREGHKAGVDLVEDILLGQPSPSGGENNFNVLPAWQRDQAIGVKMVSVFPENQERFPHLPSVQGVYVLFDGANGEPLAVIDGTALTLRKTAADSGLGSHFLARPDAEDMLMVGAGALGPHVIMAHCAARPTIKRVRVWNRTAARAEALAQEMTREVALPGVEVTAIGDLEGAAREADVISCATMAKEALIAGAWLKPGCHLDLIGGWREDMREADDEAVRRAKVYADSRQGGLRCGDITSPIAAGVLSEESVVGDLYELSRGLCPARESGQEITFFKNAGGGHLDLFTARFLLSRLEADSAGP